MQELPECQKTGTITDSRLLTLSPLKYRDNVPWEVGHSICPQEQKSVNQCLNLNEETAIYKDAQWLPEKERLYVEWAWIEHKYSSKSN